MAGVFAGIDEAKVNEGGNFLRPGIYSFKIEKLEMGQTRKKQDFFVANLICLSAAPVADQPVAKPPHGVGEKLSWMVMTSWDGWLGKVKAFLAASLAIDPSAIDEAGAEASVSAEQPFKDLVLSCESHDVTTKGRGVTFTEARWFPKAA